MRIALLTGEYPPQLGGIGDYTQQLGQALAARGHAVFVFTIADGRFQIVDLAESDSNLQFTICNQQSDWGWRSWRDAIAALDRTHPDVLHIQYQTGAYDMRPAVNLLPWRLKRLVTRPAVAVTAHDLLLPYLFPKAGPARRWVTRRLLHDADAVVVTNEADFAEVIGRWGLRLEAASRRTDAGRLSRKPQDPSLIPIGSNIAVAPPSGYDRAAWRERLGVTANEVLVAYFGLISRTKGLDTLLGALARLPARFRLLVIGGAATAPEDRAFVAELAHALDAATAGGRTIVTGHCPPADVSGHLMAADLAALPYADGASFRRGSLLAALAHGTPTVTTHPADAGTGVQLSAPTMTTDRAQSRGRRSASGVHLEDGANALLVPPGDAGALAGAIERLAGDADLRARIGAGGRELAAQFSWETIAQRHEELYARLIGADPPQPARDQLRLLE